MAGAFRRPSHSADFSTFARSSASGLRDYTAPAFVGPRSSALGRVLCLMTEFAPGAKRVPMGQRKKKNGTFAGWTMSSSTRMGPGLYPLFTKIPFIKIPAAARKIPGFLAGR
jgi:hypothetical protein